MLALLRARPARALAAVSPPLHAELTRRVVAASRAELAVKERRKDLDAALPKNPLGAWVSGASALPPITVAIPVHEKDSWLLDAVVRAAVDGTLNPVFEVQLWHTAGATPLADRCRARLIADGLPVRLMSELEFVPVEVRAKARSIAQHRTGWVLQQAIKFLAVLRAPTASTLVLDADTLLIRPRTWVTWDGVQILSPSVEYEPAYRAHLERFSGRHDAAPVSFITHHQLMQRDILEQVIGTGLEGLEQWLEAARPSDADEPLLSEYHTYGAVLWDRCRDRAVLAASRNRRVRRLELEEAAEGDPDALDRLRMRYPGALSLSCHAWVEQELARAD